MSQPYVYVLTFWYSLTLLIPQFCKYYFLFRMIFIARQGEKSPPHSWLLSRNFKTQWLFLPRCFSPELHKYLYYTTYHLAAIIFYVYLHTLGYEPLEDGTGFLNHLCIPSIYMLFEWSPQRWIQNCWEDTRIDVW